MDKVKPGYHGAGWGSGQRLKFPPVLKDPPRAGNTADLTTDLVVACVNTGTKFPSYYVDRLYRAVMRNLTEPARFMVLTDQKRHDYVEPVGQQIIDRPNLVGWYSKINLFSPAAFTAGVRVLYFDLDVVITGSLDLLAMCTEPFIMIRDFHPKPDSAHNSSVMAWKAGYANDVYEQFEDGWMERSWGDQECIWKILGNDRIWDWPDEWVRSYKWHGRGQLSPGARVVVFHGDPKPDAVSHPWVTENWK